VATLVGAVEAVHVRFLRVKEHVRADSFRRPAELPESLGTSPRALASMVSPEFDEHRVAGRSLSLEQAADLALRVLDEELALVAAAGAGGSDRE
jgi:hypothetical protein